MGSKTSYPKKERLKLNGRAITAQLYCQDDLLTVNEIFFREDYYIKGDEKCIIDLGSNIGISALYFLCVAPEATLYAYEPVPQNYERLKENISSNQFLDQINLNPLAVHTKGGSMSFGIENTGRYGGIGLDFNETISVKCIGINTLLAQVLKKEKKIDVLKIDTEGNELELLQKIKFSFLEKIDVIYVESEHAIDLKGFSCKQRGFIFRYERK